MADVRALMQPHPPLAFADPVLADLIERARAAQIVAASAQSAVWAYIDQCQQGTVAPEQYAWPIHADHPDLLTVAQAAALLAGTLTRSAAGAGDEASARCTVGGGEYQSAGSMA